jgi:antirestriction protein ArdC
MVDIYADVTLGILEQLEKGVAPWIRPWDVLGGIPMNWATRRRYSGMNVLYLAVMQHKKGYPTGEWATLNQIRQAGGWVKREEFASSVPVIWFEMVKYKPKPGYSQYYRPTIQQPEGENVEQADEDEEIKKKGFIPIAKEFKVWNIAQCTGIFSKIAGKPRPLTMPEVEATLQQIIKDREIDTRFGGDAAFYQPLEKFVNMPLREMFNTDLDYYVTWLHELVHWTAGPLNRVTSIVKGSNEYGFEELVAELGSAFSCARLQLQGKTMHPEYIGAWIKIMKGSNKAIFKAARLAQAATDYLFEGLKAFACERCGGVMTHGTEIEAARCIACGYTKPLLLEQEEKEYQIAPPGQTPPPESNGHNGNRLFDWS